MNTIQIAPEDNVAVALCPIKKGETIDVGEHTLSVREDIPQGHKIALKTIKTLSNTALPSDMHWQIFQSEAGFTHTIWQQTLQERLNTVIILPLRK